MDKKGVQGSSGLAVLLLLALMFGGLIMLTNMFNIEALGLSFNGVRGFMPIFWIVLARVVGLLMFGFGAYAIYRIVTD